MKNQRVKTKGKREIKNTFVAFDRSFVKLFIFTSNVMPKTEVNATE